MKTELFQYCGHCWVFQICWHIECSTFTASSFRIWNSSTGIPSPPLALFLVMLSKAHLTSHSRMSGSKWVLTPSWLRMRHLPRNNMSHSRWLKFLLVQGGSSLSLGSGDLSPVCFGVQLQPNYVGSSELSWEILSPETKFWGCSLEWHSFVILNRYLRSPRGSQVYWVSSSVFFHGLTHESWIQDSCHTTLTAVGVESITV